MNETEKKNLRNKNKRKPEIETIKDITSTSERECK